MAQHGPQSALIAKVDGAMRAGMRWHKNHRVERHRGWGELLTAHFAIDDSRGGSTLSSLICFFFDVGWGFGLSLHVR